MSGEEFSFLLASMLKPGQAGEFLKAALLETSGNAIPADDGQAQFLTASGTVTEEAIEVKDGGQPAPEAAGNEAPLNVPSFPHTPAEMILPIELSAFAVLVGPAQQNPLSGAPPIAYNEAGITQKKPDAVPSNFYLPVQPLDGCVAAKAGEQGDIAPVIEAAGSLTNAVSGKSRKNEELPGKTGAASNEKGRIELAPGLLNDSGQQEHFEIEIPAEDILKHSVVEPEQGPAIAASGAKPEALENVDFSVLFEQEPVERPGQPGRAEKVSFEEGRSPQADLGFTFHGSEDHEQDSGSRDSAGASANHVHETHGAKPEHIISAAFDKLIDSPVKEAPAAPVRMAPLASEVQEKVQAGIKVSLEQGGGEVKMKLNPESLGEVRIKLNVSSGMVKAEIIVENPEVKHIIESDSSFLRESLGSHGLTLEKCVVEVGRPSDARGREGSGESALSGDERRPMKDRDEKGSSNWQRHYRGNHGRQEDGGVDFFI